MKIFFGTVLLGILGLRIVELWNRLIVEKGVEWVQAKKYGTRKFLNRRDRKERRAGGGECKTMSGKIMGETDLKAETW